MHTKGSAAWTNCKQFERESEMGGLNSISLDLPSNANDEIEASLKFNKEKVLCFRCEFIPLYFSILVVFGWAIFVVVVVRLIYNK